MKWIKLIDEKPKEDLVAWVCNNKWNSSIHAAIYHKKEDVFILYDPSIIESLSLEITHWIQIPSIPSKDEE